MAISVNSELTLMYWHIGERINRDVLHDKRDEYGKAIVSTLSAQLMDLYGKDFNSRNLHRMMQFAREFGDFQIVSTLSTQLPWSAFLEVLPGEESPLGLLLCAAGNDEQIQLLQLGDAGIQVSQYYTELPDKDLLKAQLQKQIAQAKLRMENHNDE